ncbi:hypothetical protein ACP26L_12245 [Paenibacillus sp. S-38]|uniref:hypothetical protein n=1 Tax=Paenibacillus sp. S-38 TaxID=3416710 RepID=UPI003CEEA855
MQLNNQSTTAAEFVSCRLKAGVDREEFLRHVRASQSSLKQYPGYVSRELYHDAHQGTWFDLVRWADMKSAEQAAEKFMDDPRAAGLIGCLDPAGLAMHHYDWREELGAVSARNPIDTASGCVEILQYRLLAGAGLPQYEDVLREMSGTLRTHAGFIRREVYYSAKTGQWLETIFYRDRASADAMFGEIKDAPCMKACMEMLDEPTLTMTFAVPVALGGEVVSGPAWSGLAQGS